MKLHAEPKPLRNPLAGGEQGTTVTVEPLLGGEIESPRAFFERAGGRLETLKLLGVGTPRSKWWTVPCPAFLITHPKAGPMLVDTGLHPSVAAKPSENMGRTWARFATAAHRAGGDVPAQLRERGIEARDLPLVVMTHLHQDHASGMSEFPNSTFVISRRGVARSDHRTPARCCAATGRRSTTTSSTTGRSAMRGRASPHTRPSAAPSTCSATAACGSPSRPDTRRATRA